MKRPFLAVVAALLFASTVFAAHPAQRNHARMVYDPLEKSTLLFGGESMFDPATQITYDSEETWIWNGARWTQVFPANHPPSRSAHGMVYDSTRDRIVLFGGRRAKTTFDGDITLLNDTWIWNGTDWSQISTPHAPDPRQLMAMMYDPTRDRIVLYGGTKRTADGKAGSFEATYDTWEFDGTDWTRVADTEPKVKFPNLAYDVARNQTILVGVDDAVKTLMYSYDTAAHTWNKLTPEKLPDCANDAVMVYRARTQEVVLLGGVCTVADDIVDKTWEWNGTNWSEATLNNPLRATGQAIAYDALRDTIVTFGGNNAFSTTPRAFTFLLKDDYRSASDIARPSPRSLAAFTTDPVNRTAWLYGGLELEDATGSQGYLDEFDPSVAFIRIWGYQNGSWFSLALEKAPSQCIGPMAAFDSNRSKLVVTCQGSDIFEFDGKTWTEFTPKNHPPARRFAGMVYDENIKKIVVFGGWDDSNYRQDTWTWDGVDWTEVKKNRPPHRSLMAMWYDPLLKRTVFYGGLGRKNIEERITRYSDMYSFDGNGWTKMNVTTTPGERFGSQYTIDPRTGKLILFGGLRSEITDPKNNIRRQFYDNDTWQWDGAASSWTRINTPNAPTARENGMLAFDPARNEIVLFGGYAGFYFSDTWTFNGVTWTPRPDPAGNRRRRQ